MVPLRLPLAPMLGPQLHLEETNSSATAPLGTDTTTASETSRSGTTSTTETSSPAPTANPMPSTSSTSSSSTQSNPVNSTTPTTHTAISLQSTSDTIIGATQTVSTTPTVNSDTTMSVIFESTTATGISSSVVSTSLLTTSLAAEVQVSTIHASCRLKLQINERTEPLDLVPLVTTALASALQVDEARLRNVVVETVRRLAAQETSLRVSYEVIIAMENATQLLSTVTTLADPTSDVASRFSDSLELEGLNVTSIQVLEVPRIITESHLQDPPREHLLQSSQIILWILMGVAISTVAGCAAWGAGYLCGYLHVRRRQQLMMRMSSKSTQSSEEFPFSVVNAQSTLRSAGTPRARDSSFDAPMERSGLSPSVNKSISRKSHDGTLRASAHQNTGKSVIREVIL